MNQACVDHMPGSILIPVLSLQPLLFLKVSLKFISHTFNLLSKQFMLYYIYFQFQNFFISSSCTF